MKTKLVNGLTPRWASSLLFLVSASCSSTADDTGGGGSGAQGGAADGGGGNMQLGGMHEGGGGAAPSCPGPDMLLAPQPAAVGLGMPAVPIDIASVQAKIVFDFDTQTASVEAVMQFEMGAVDGYPIFDLRQDV